MKIAWPRSTSGVYAKPKIFPTSWDYLALISHSVYKPCGTCSCLTALLELTTPRVAPTSTIASSGRGNPTRRRWKKQAERLPVGFQCRRTLLALTFGEISVNAVNVAVTMLTRWCFTLNSHLCNSLSWDDTFINLHFPPRPPWQNACPIINKVSTLVCAGVWAASAVWLTKLWRQSWHLATLLQPQSCNTWSESTLSTCVLLLHLLLDSSICMHAVGLRWLTTSTHMAAASARRTPWWAST